MTKTATAVSDHEAVSADVPPERRRAGQLVMRGATALLLLVVAVQTFSVVGLTDFGFSNWFPILVAYVLWSVALCWGLVLRDGEAGWRALFILPAVLFTVALVIFPTVFGFFIAFSEWNLSSTSGRTFNGLANFYQLMEDEYFWNALLNMVFYVATALVQYAIAFGLALLLNADIKAQKFFRVAFLLPFMLSPVAVSWMIGKSMLEFRFGPVTNLLRWFGWENPSLLTSPWLAKITIAFMDAWVWIPFMMIMILAGLQALSKEVQEAALVDGATGWQGFWQITFPLMLPVSVTTIVLRIIFQLKLADIVINTTSGGPGGATDTVSSYIFRVYKDRSTVGYGTMIAEVYLIIIIVFLALLLKFTSKYMQRVT